MSHMRTIPGDHLLRTEGVDETEPEGVPPHAVVSLVPVEATTHANLRARAAAALEAQVGAEVRHDKIVALVRRVVEYLAPERLEERGARLRGEGRGCVSESRRTAGGVVLTEGYTRYVPSRNTPKYRAARRALATGDGVRCWCTRKHTTPSAVRTSGPSVIMNTLS